MKQDNNDTVIKVRNLCTNDIEYWTIGQLLYRINEDNATDDFNYTLEDWKEGFKQTLEGESYSLYDKEGKPLSEHPQETKEDETIKEGDLLDKFIEAIKEEFKDHNWDYLYFIADKVRDNNPTLAKENKRLSASNKELMEALKWIEMKSWQKDEWKDMKDINDKAKAAIQNNTIKP